MEKEKIILSYVARIGTLMIMKSLKSQNYRLTILFNCGSAMLLLNASYNDATNKVCRTQIIIDDC